MSETDALAGLRLVIANGLMSASSLYDVEGDGGARPRPEWEGHGPMARVLLTLRGGELVRLPFFKQRWRRKGTNETLRSLPPDDCTSLWFCSLLVAVSLWRWLSSGDGAHAYTPVLDELVRHRSRHRRMRPRVRVDLAREPAHRVIRRVARRVARTLDSRARELHAHARLDGMLVAAPPSKVTRHRNS
jgi:hypothetical protein